MRADEKYAARLNVLRDFLSRVNYPDKNDALVRPDRTVVFSYEAAARQQGLIAP